jgi:hypothetical protein
MIKYTYRSKFGLISSKFGYVYVYKKAWEDDCVDEDLVGGAHCLFGDTVSEETEIKRR